MPDTEKIRAACIKANPSILDLKIGCIVVAEFVPGITPDIFVDLGEDENGEELYHTLHYPDGFSSKWRIIGRPIRLADVLLAIEKAGIVGAFEGQLIEGIFTFLHGFPNKVGWNLKDDNLENQSEETKKFIARLL
ncbi:MAG TPA: hypothetical protein ENI23_14100 [bacterium]|nr:hypothetical protein [bacterium]